MQCVIFLKHFTNFFFSLTRYIKSETKLPSWKGKNISSMSSNNRVTTARYHDFVIIDFYLEPFPPPCYPTSSRSFTMRRRFLEEGWKVITGRAQVETSLPAVFESFLPFRSVWKGGTRMGSRKSGEKSRGAWNRGALSCRVMTARQRDALCSRRNRNSTRGTARGRGKRQREK